MLLMLYVRQLSKDALHTSGLCADFDDVSLGRYHVSQSNSLLQIKEKNKKEMFTVSSAAVFGIHFDLCPEHLNSW